MKKKTLLILLILMIALLTVRYLFSGAPYFEKRLKNGLSIEIRQYANWEMSIPIYYTVKRNIFKVFESSPIFYGDPRSVMAKKINFEIIDYPEIKAFVILNGAVNLIV